MSIIKIQEELKAPKNQRNNFGNYNYRSAEDIIEAVKPIAHKYGYYLNISDDIREIGGRVYIMSTAALIPEGKDDRVIVTSFGWAREEETKKGMDGAQITGSASSYARKYALNGLLAIDDTKDSDATNTHGKDKIVVDVAPQPSVDIKPWLNNTNEKWSSIKSKLKDGTLTINTLRNHFKISKAVEAELNN